MTDVARLLQEIAAAQDLAELAASSTKLPA